MGRLNVAVVVVENIKRDILTGKYREGDKLANERDLCEQYGVSRMTIRKALDTLRDEGILFTRHGVGTYIERANKKLLAKEPVNYSADNEKLVLESLRARVLVEVKGCGLAARNADASDIEALQKHLFMTIDEIKKLKTGVNNQFFDSDMKFHTAIATASHDPFYPAYLATIGDTISVHQFLSLQVTDPADEVITYHTSIFGAIISRDEERAMDTMRNHMNRVVEHVRNSLKNKKK